VNPAIARVVAGLLGCTAGFLWLLCMYLVGRSGLSADPLVDPHGYALVFGTVVGIPAAVLCAVALPAAFGPRHRRTALRVCLPALAVPTALLYAALYLL
jgi:hypothetical protein